MASKSATIPPISRRRVCATAAGASNHRRILRGSTAISAGRAREASFILLRRARPPHSGWRPRHPMQLLDLDNRAIFTTPQTTDNKMGLVALNGKYALTDAWSLQGNLYIRGFSQDHVDGNGADLERCSTSSSPQFINHLCLEDDGFPRPNPVTTAFHDQFAILDMNGNPIPCPPGSGNPAIHPLRNRRSHRKPRDHVGRVGTGR